MDRRFRGFVILTRNGRERWGNGFTNTDVLQFRGDGVLATAVGGRFKWPRDLLLAWASIESWTVSHGSGPRSLLRRTPRSQTVIRSRDGQSVSFVSTVEDAEVMADVARGQLPPQIISEQWRTSETRVLALEKPDSEIKPFGTPLRFLGGAALLGGGALLWLAIGPTGANTSGGVLVSLLLGAVMAIGAVVSFLVAVWDRVRRKRHDGAMS